MRTFLFLAALTLVGCAPDPTLGTFDYTMTGTDTQTAPGSDVTNTTGAGVLAITTGKANDYLITVAHSDTTPCTFNADRNDKGDTIALAAGQSCKLLGGATAVLTTGKLSVTEKGESATLEVTYSYSGTGLFGINYTGNGVRKYTGPRR